MYPSVSVRSHLLVNESVLFLEFMLTCVRRMHHANVDRILAIWQAIHPSLWVTPSVVTTNSQTWNLGVGAKMDAQTRK